MAKDEPKSIKEVDRELAEKAEQLEEKIKEAETKHPSPSVPASDEDGTPPPEASP